MAVQCSAQSIFPRPFAANAMPNRITNVMKITDRCASAGARFDHVMFRRLKVAVALLVLVFFTVPSFAVVTCVGRQEPVAAQSQMPCCRMMAEMNAAAAVQLSAQQHTGAPCCKVSNTRPSPSALPQTPVMRVSVVPQGVSTAPGLVPAPFLVRRQQARPQCLPESPQSLLCVFLI